MNVPDGALPGCVPGGVEPWLLAMLDQLHTAAARGDRAGVAAVCGQIGQVSPALLARIVQIVTEQASQVEGVNR